MRGGAYILLVKKCAWWRAKRMYTTQHHHFPFPTPFHILFAFYNKKTIATKNCYSHLLAVFHLYYTSLHKNRRVICCINAQKNAYPSFSNTLLKYFFKKFLNRISTCYPEDIKFIPTHCSHQGR